MKQEDFDSMKEVIKKDLIIQSYLNYANRLADPIQEVDFHLLVSRAEQMFARVKEILKEHNSDYSQKWYNMINGLFDFTFKEPGSKDQEKCLLKSWRNLPSHDRLSNEIMFKPFINSIVDSLIQMARTKKTQFQTVPVDHNTILLWSLCNGLNMLAAHMTQILGSNDVETKVSVVDFFEKVPPLIAKEIKGKRLGINPKKVLTTSELNSLKELKAIPEKDYSENLTVDYLEITYCEWFTNVLMDGHKAKVMQFKFKMGAFDSNDNIVYIPINITIPGPWFKTPNFK